MTAPYKFWLANLSLLKIRPADIRRLLANFGDAKKVYEAPDYKLSFFLNETKVAYIQHHRKKWDVTGAYENFSGSDCRFITCDDADYPKMLSDIHDPPYALFIRGRLPNPAQYCVGVIGARHCSEYGCKVAVDLGAALADAGIQVISGLAYGIDSLAQNAAIEKNGAVFAVLGSGVDVCYPAKNRELYEKIAATGGILSEFAPKTPPISYHFPLRNRIISAFSDSIAIVEAALKSGTAITVKLALEQGKDVYAVPGRIGDITSMGCNYLIKDGAGVITEIDDFIRSLRENAVGKSISKKGDVKDTDITSPVKTKNLQMELTELPLKGLPLLVYAALNTQWRSLDEILTGMVNAGATISFEELCAVLLELEITGYITQESGCYRKG